jgi:hypothetical protein
MDTDGFDLIDWLSSSGKLSYFSGYDIFPFKNKKRSIIAWIVHQRQKVQATVQLGKKVKRVRITQEGEMYRKSRKFVVMVRTGERDRTNEV